MNSLRKLMAVCGLLLGLRLGAAEPYARFDLGVGSYGTTWTWGGGTELDIARMDWAIVAFGNEKTDLSTVARLNRLLEINPKLKFVLRLWPRSSSLKVFFLDYLYDATAKKAFNDEVRRQIRLVLDNIVRPENVQGVTLFEELPYQFAPDIRCLAETAPDAPLDPYLATFADWYRAETGLEMKCWNRDVRLWWGKKFAEALCDVYRHIKAEEPRLRNYVWFMSHYRLLDWLEPGEDVHSPKVIPCRWCDIVKPGEAADGFFAYCNNSFWADKYLTLAKENGWPYFTQLSHTATMRIGSWEDCLSIAKADLPENMGYFYYGPDFRYGLWNDDPDVRPEDIPSVSGMYPRARRFLAKEKVNLDIVRSYLKPSLTVSHNMGTVAVGGFAMVTAVVTNLRDEKWLPDEDCEVRDVTLTVETPPEFEIPVSASCPESVRIARLRPGETKAVIWWAQRKRPSSDPRNMPLKVSLSAANAAAVEVSSTEPVLSPQPEARFAFKSSRGMFRYVDYAMGWSQHPTRITIENPRRSRSLCVNPSIRKEGIKLTWRGVLKEGERLVLGPGVIGEHVGVTGERRDVTAELVGTGITVGKGVSCLEYADEYADGDSEKAIVTIDVPRRLEEIRSK